jgi:fatty-acyl-CoA synthase
MFYKHPAVLEAACIAVPDEQWGEAPMDIVVLRRVPGRPKPACRVLSGEMAHFKCPRRIAFMDALL